jgi:hypothetical protein
MVVDITFVDDDDCRERRGKLRVRVFAALQTREEVEVIFALD